MNEKIIIISGGSTGIGAESAKLFAQDKAIVHVLDNQPLSYRLPNVIHHSVDISARDIVRGVVKKIGEEHGKIDILFSNAGIHLFASLENSTDQDIDRVINVNLMGTIFLVQSVIPYMRRAGGGSIVLMGSDQSLIGKGESTIYGLTKGAIGQMAKSLSIDLAKDKIRVNCVCPGTIETPLYHKAVRGYAEKVAIDINDVYNGLATAQPIHRVGQPEEVAQLVYFLSSDKAGFITGGLYPVDGGYTAQ